MTRARGAAASARREDDAQLSGWAGGAWWSRSPGRETRECGGLGEGLTSHFHLVTLRSC